MSARKLELICAAGLVLNLVGAFVANVLNLPVYLDSVGTIFIAGLGGYVPGITVGFFTNLLKALLIEPKEMYFCSVSILIAIVTTFIVRKKEFDSTRKVAILIGALTIFAGTFDLLTENFLNTTSIIKSVDAIETNFAQNFCVEFADKAISVLLAVALIKHTPQDVKNFFRVFGQRQAPLSDEMKRVINRRSHLSASLRTKMLLILVASSLFISFSIALISYLLFKDTVIDDRIKAADGIVAVVLNEINPYRVDDYIKDGRLARGYKETEQEFYAIKNSNSDIKYIYVYRFSEEGCQVIFDLDTAAIEGDKPGQIIEFEKTILPYRADLIAGKPIPPIITDDEYGYLLTLYKPLYDYQGKCVCYAAVDYSMDILTDYLRNFLIKLIALFVGCFVFITVIGLAFVQNNIILPVNTMAYCARNFSYDSEEARRENIGRLKALQIRTSDEIENLYRALIRTTENILRYLEHLQKAKSQVADMRVKFNEMDELAHKDSLTGVQNKTAYNEKIAELDKTISDGTANFSITMVDVNFLKRVNDTYGHERGNEYLINACRLTCAVFGTENVYRIGGDEFVVILEGERSSISKYFVAQFKVEMERKNSNAKLKPWEKISVAVGVSYYNQNDKSADEVFKRADAQMYANKLAMKAARRS